MGQYFKIVNASKKEFIDICDLGENNKFYYVGQGLNGIALGRLLMSGGDDWTEDFYRVYGHPKKDRLYFGAWAGDKIVIAGDYDQADTNGIKSSFEDGTTPNLYDRVELDNEYKDITLEVIEWLAKHHYTANMLVERAKIDLDLLKILSDLVFIKKQRLIEKSLVELIGPDWTKKLKNK